MNALPFSFPAAKRCIKFLPLFLMSCVECLCFAETTNFRLSNYLNKRKRESSLTGVTEATATLVVVGELDTVDAAEFVARR